MGKKKHKGKFDKIQEQAYEFYFRKWRGNEKICPALGEVVYATRAGWDHLVDPPKGRGKSDKVDRFRVLPLAKKLLETATTFQEKRVRGIYHYWAIEAVMGGTRIRVIVSSRGPRGRRIFYSVMLLK